ncbi:G-protein coupled receptor Mth-like [Eurytemora carolleeae]|uniref:G-protein coupled receptor Mth-like n=1 Tax=Eurytemora carolleeae TaxID=1294199 RepID=UPI000C767F2D|nr:G-protein coupled receptor Mth-like [Eurytemora carolleeae]|eukprot:XP_023329254.1 G-protein coupled receptor Mth-like [Eurytemora affinis]
MGVTLLLTLCFLKFAKSHHFEHILGSVQEKVEVGIDGNSSNLFALREREMCDLKPGVNMVPTIYMMKCCAADKIFNVNSGSCEDGLFNTSLVQVWRFQSSSSQLDLEQEFSPRPLSDTDLMICSSLLTQEDCGELSRTILDPVLRPQEEFMLLENGTLRMPKLGLYFTSSPQQYCVEQFHTGDQISIHVVVCAREMMDSDEDKDENASCSARFILYPIVESLSSLGLLLTLICYSILPEFRNVPGRCLQCLCFTLLSAMLLLLFTQILGNSIYNKMGLCKVVASLLQFSFLSAFSWMTVLSLDISRAFHLMQVSTTNPSLGRPKSTKKLGLYSLLGFGIPLIITAITAIMDQTLNTNFLRPRFGERGCWFFGNMEILLYFYSPVIILLLANILLFVRTVSSLAIVERKTSFKKGQIRKHSMSQLHQEYSQGREMLSLSVRLFVIMGGLWIFEVVSWIGHTLDHPCWIYIPTDILNLLQVYPQPSPGIFSTFSRYNKPSPGILKLLQVYPQPSPCILNLLQIYLVVGYHERASLARSVSGNCSIAGGAGASGYGTGGGEAVAGTRGEGAGSGQGSY